MSEHQVVTTFSRRVILYYDSYERGKPENRIAQVEPQKRFASRLASVIALFTVLAIAGVGWMVVFAGLLMGYHKKLKRLPDARQLVTRRQESALGKPDITTFPGSYRGSDTRKSFQGAAKVSGDRGSLDSPSWRFNRLCG